MSKKLSSPGNTVSLPSNPQIVDYWDSIQCLVLSGNRTDYTISKISDGNYLIRDNRPECAEIDKEFVCGEIRSFKFDNILIDADLATDLTGQNSNGLAGQDASLQPAGQNQQANDYGQSTATGTGNSKKITSGNEKDTLEGADDDDVLLGGNGKDTLRGGAGNDFLDGQNGKDILIGGAGDDRLEGGRGVDEAVFSGKFSDYSIETDSQGRIVVEDLRPGSPDGRDTLSTVEVLTFSDQQVELDKMDPAPVAGFEVGKINSILENVTNGGTIIAGNLNSDGMVIASIEVKDDSWTGSQYQITESNGSVVEDTRFEISDNEVRVADGAVFDFESEPTISLYITAQNSRGETFTQPIEITIDDFEGTYNGSDSSEIIQGTSEEDFIFAGGGDDTIDGGEGADTIVIDGRTTVRGNNIADSGNTGIDTLVLSGAPGDSFEIQQEFSAASSGIEVIDGSAIDGEVIRTLGGAANFDFSEVELRGVDAIRGRAREDDRITGSNGDDHIIGKSGNDTLYGGAGDDLLDTGNGDDYVDGGEGSDTILLDDISTRVGNTVVDSGANGDDRVILSGKDNDTFEIQSDFSASSGIEEIDGSHLHGESIRTIDGAARFDFTGVKLTGVDEIRGTRHDDSITGSDGNDTFTLGQGSDTLDGGDGEDDVLVFSGQRANYSIHQSGDNFIIEGSEGTKVVKNVESLRFSDSSLNLAELANGHAPSLQLGVFKTAFGEDDINLDNLSLYSIAPQTVGGQLSYGKDIGPTGPGSGEGKGPEGVIYTDTEIGPGFFRYTFNGQQGGDFSDSFGNFLNFANGQIENPSRQNTPGTSDVVLVATNGDSVSVELNYGTYGRSMPEFGEVFQYSISLTGESFGTSDEKLASILANLEYVDVRVETNYGVTGAESFLTQPDPSYDQIYVIDSTQLYTTDPLDDPSSLTFSVEATEGGHFVFLSETGEAIESFTQQDVNEGQVGFLTPGGDVEPPTFTLSVTDSQGDTDFGSVVFETGADINFNPLDAIGLIADETDDIFGVVTDSGELLEFNASSNSDSNSLQVIDDLPPGAEEGLPVLMAPPLPEDLDQLMV